MRGNGHGALQSTPARDQRAHDALPPALRYAMNYAVANFSAEEALADFEHAASCGMASSQTCNILIEQMRARDRLLTARYYGPSHPEALPGQSSR